MLFHASLPRIIILATKIVHRNTHTHIKWAENTEFYGFGYSVCYSVTRKSIIFTRFAWNPLKRFHFKQTSTFSCLFLYCFHHIQIWFGVSLEQNKNAFKFELKGNFTAFRHSNVQTQTLRCVFFPDKYYGIKISWVVIAMKTNEKLLCSENACASS